MIDFFEEIAEGDCLELGSYHFSAEDIIRFAKDYDPQAFHLSEEGAERTHFGRLCASGWHTASVFMRLLVLKRQEMEEEALATGQPVAALGPSPGFENLRWLKPVYAGDTITYRRTVAGKRASGSRPGWGLVFGHNEGHNQHGELVFSFDSKVFLALRGDT
ncbi:MaoC family dehydratase [Roseibium aestuarii]|uniref:MaoC family dehydratase n=1 Tax=Roseibium aestuarii TaxID=2600299 RepID=A0ABW4JXP6_9HYPH|nr:MaoC family dehydratase [Roseibium aestuarii]